jgi:hypothetical protein
MRYEQAETFDEIVEVVKKKEESIEDIPQLTMQSMAKRNSILD